MFGTPEDEEAAARSEEQVRDLLIVSSQPQEATVLQCQSASEAYQKLCLGELYFEETMSNCFWGS